MKRIALVVLMVTVLALVAACGSNEPLPEPEPTPGEATGLDGATILQEKCTVCHDLERVDAMELDDVGWAALIDDMIARGADLSEDESAALAEYLSLR